MAHREHHRWRLGRDAPDGRPAQGCRRLLTRLLTAGHRFEQVYGGTVREVGDRHLGQLARRDLHVEGGADTGTGLIEQRQSPARPVTVRDVLDELGDTEDPAGRVLHTEGRNGDEHFPARVMPQVAGLLGEDQGFTRVDHPPQPRLHHGRVPVGDEVSDAHPRVVLGRNAAEPCDRPVHP